MGKGLAAALEAAANAQHHQPCSVGKIIAGLSPADRAALEAAFASDMQHAQIFTALKSEFPEMDIPTATTLGRHRRGGCKC